MFEGIVKTKFAVGNQVFDTEQEAIDFAWTKLTGGKYAAFLATLDASETRSITQRQAAMETLAAFEAWRLNQPAAVRPLQ